MNLIQLGKIILSSGVESDFKLECDRFIEENADGLAYLINKMVGPFSSVEGVPRGGLRLAEALQPYVVTSGMGVPYRNLHLLVDDVLTTGGSMERLRATHYGQGPAGRPGIIGAVVFTRGMCPSWIQPLFQMPSCFWITKRDWVVGALPPEDQPTGGN